MPPVSCNEQKNGYENYRFVLLEILGHQHLNNPICCIFKFAVIGVEINGWRLFDGNKSSLRVSDITEMQ